MKKVFLLAIGFALMVCAGAAKADFGACDDEVMTVEGPVVGYQDPAYEACGYKGIPFAEGPVDELRWRPPLPAPPRSEVLLANEFGYRCVSGGSGSGATASMLPEISEDCLNLNVWRPLGDGPFPVMFWIHGGSLTTGTAAEPIYYGERLASARDVVVVSINYRLNFYGFLAHPSLAEEDPNGSSGNYGLMDQVAGLKWVKANINNFGGDPDNVTIFGESAGGWSVCHLLASPLAAGLFHKAVIESGGCDSAKSAEGGYEDGEAFAEKLGCSGSDAADCMREMSVEEIGLALERAAKESDGGGEMLSADMLKFTWVPHVDGHALKQIPKEALRSGAFNRVPLMVGSNRDEIKLFTVALPGARLLPKSMIRKGFAEMFGDEILEGVEELYPYRDYNRPLDAMLDAAGDLGLGCPCWEAAEAASQYQPVYYYRFDFDGHMVPDLVGAAHGLEIPFVLGTLDQFPINVFLTSWQTRKAQKLAEQPGQVHVLEGERRGNGGVNSGSCGLLQSHPKATTRIRGAEENMRHRRKADFDNRH